MVIILAQDDVAIQPSVAKATGEGIPVIAYDRLIEDPKVLYLTFDNVEVGRMQAGELLKVAPKGNYAIIKGNEADNNARFLREGYRGDHRRRREGGRHQDRRRGVHRQLEARHRADQHGSSS